MADLVGAVLELFVHGGKLAMNHVKEQVLPSRDRLKEDGGGAPVFAPLRLEPLEGLRGLESLPALEAATVGVGVASQALPHSARANVPENVPGGPSYAAEFGGMGYDDASPVACWACMVRHLGAMTGAAEEAAAGRMDAREAAVTIRGEAECLARYDLTKDKLANTSPGRRAPILAAATHVEAATRCLPDAPARLPLAWATAVEAYRFANSSGGNPSPMECRERDLRMVDVMQWVALLDTLPTGPEAAPHLDAIRRARHGLNAQGNAPEAIAPMRDALRAAAVAMVAAPSTEQVAEAGRSLAAAKKAFYGGALAEMRGRAKPPAQKVYRDVDLRIPEELRGALLQVAPADTASLLGATPQMRQAFAWLLQFDQACGVPVRVEDFPTIVEDGQALGTIRGAFYPLAGKNGAIEIGPSAASMRPQGLYTLTHENVHFIDHRQGCNPYDSTDVAYEDMPEEFEADAGATLALLLAGDPEEDDFGRAIPEAEVRRRLRSLERRMTAQMIRRAEQAGRILAMALKGDPQGAAALAATCPR